MELASFLALMPSMHDDWSAAILVGGHGRRLGHPDKSATLIGGRTILARQLDVLDKCRVPVTLVTRQGQTPVESRRTLVDSVPEVGPLGALYTALAASPTPLVLILAGDLPFLTQPFLDYLMHAAHESACVIPRSEGRLHPLCAAYPATAAAAARARISRGALAVQDLCQDVPCRMLEQSDLAPFDADGMLLFNVNTPDDLRRAERHAQQLDRTSAAPTTDRHHPSFSGPSA